MASGRQRRERDQETVRLVNAALDANPVDLLLLRKLAAVRGLVTDQVRARVWPTLLGADVHAVAVERYKQHALERHRDSSTVQCDVDRSMWHLTEGWTDDRRAAKRAALQRVLNGVVGLHAESVYYYQGLHDIASVLLLVCGESASYALLERLVLGHLRDCTRATLEPVTQVLQLLMPLLAQADAPLHAFLERSGVMPFFALTWVLTWHVHDVRDLATAARLFDLFISSTPLMPLYVGVAALVAERAVVLSLPCDASELHRHLTALDVLGRLSADELAARALALYRQHPPARLQQQAGVRLPRTCAVNAYPFVAPARQPGRVLRALPLPFAPVQGERAMRMRRGAVRVARTLGASAAVVATVALLGGGGGALGAVGRALLAAAA